MRNPERVTFANMCMVCDGGRVVVQDRRDPEWPGIVFPGGHVEEGESFAASVIREVWEETGLEISSPHLCGIKHWHNETGRHVVLLYRADCFHGELRGSSEGDVFWADLALLPQMRLARGMPETIRLFLEDDLSELCYREDGDAWVAELL